MSWTDGYIGLQYVEDVFDCVHLVERVVKEVFHKDIQLPSERSSTPFGRSHQVDTHKDDLVVLVDEKDAVDGDLIIMKCNRRLNHCGVFFKDKGMKCVLHNLKNAGGVTAHKLRDLSRINIEVEGFYRFK